MLPIDPIEASVIRRLRDNQSVTSIAQHYKIRRPTVSAIARDHGIQVRRGRPARPGTNLRAVIVDEFWRLFESGQLRSENQIASTIGVTRQYVCAVLRRAGIEAAQLIDALRQEREAALAADQTNYC